MKTKLNFDRLFVYSEKNKKYFYTEFGPGTNIIYGRNTSGKSTIVKSILYTLGINDGKDRLADILSEKIILRLDCTLTTDEVAAPITFIRDNETLLIEQKDKPLIKYSGIGSDGSAEHIKLKEYLHKLFGFSLLLESKDQYKSAPIETIFLPYYVSQSVGWVYLRKSFSNLDFYKNFKEDYLDYYLGIDNFLDRSERQRLSHTLSQVQNEMIFYNKMETDNVELQTTKIADEQFAKLSLNYIEGYKNRQENLAKIEKEYVLKCNEFSYYTERRFVLSKVNNNHKDQEPENGACPTCAQNLPTSLSARYKYLQEENDTERELADCKEKLRKLQSEINSLHKKIEEGKILIAKEYAVLKNYEEQGINYDSWLKNKANVKLLDNITYKLGELARTENETKEQLKGFKTDEEVQKERYVKTEVFEEMFLGFLRDLGVKKLEEDRYTKLYKISAFPSDGVELHKTVMAYHFAFNKLISVTGDIHRLPFLLDAIFKEDIDSPSRKLVLNFISDNKPVDTQMFLTIATDKLSEETIKGYNKDYFNNQANLICIGKATDVRSLLTKYNDEHKDYLAGTMKILYTV